MKKLLSIVFQSTQQPNKLILTTNFVESIEQGTVKALSDVVQSQGELGWTAIITQFRDLPTDIVKIVAHPVLPLATKDTVITPANQSWLLKTIISNKDTVLFDSVKKYLTEPEVLYTEAQLK